jgi:aldehyde dehydrogenase (NAD+)
MRSYTEHYIGGSWRPNRTEETIPVHHAATEEVLASIPGGLLAEAESAVGAARAAFEPWAATPASERAVYLRRIAAGVETRGEEIARSISAEVGTPLKLSRRIQADGPARVFAAYANLAASMAFEGRVGHSQVIRQPTGVVVAITPWNFPLHQVAAKLAPALAAGCTVVLKPSEVAPLSAYILAEVIEASALPPGVFNLVTGYGAQIGEALVVNPDVDLVSFTGSTRAGKRVAELASTSVTRVVQELGGKSAAIVLEDAELEPALRRTLNSCFLNSGQSCDALSRLLVPQRHYERAAALAVDYAQSFIVGDPFDPAANLGPLASAAQRDRVRRYIGLGLSEGAQLLVGGSDPPPGLKRGYYVRPTVFGRVDPQARIAQEEIFGPVLSILTFRDENEAVAIANATPYGLAGAVWSSDLSRAETLARRLRCGQVSVNGGKFNPEAPFGGFKQSGCGRELGRYGIDAYLEYQALNLPGDG